MKKNLIIYLFIVLTISVITTGCGKEVEVKNGSKVSVSTKAQKYTATEYYNSIKKDNISKLVDMIDTDLLNKKYKTTKEETTAIEKQIEQIKSYYGNNENNSSNYESILEQYFGVSSEKELKKKLSLEYKRNLAVEDYVKKSISDSEIKKYYDEKIFGEVKASHILISINTKENATDEEKQKAEDKAKKKAEKVIKELNEGKKFKDLAKKYSDDKSNSTNGGDLGYFNLDEMTEEFSNAVKGLEKGKYTIEPVKTEYGYHIILKTGEKKKKALKEVKSDIKEKLKDQKIKDDNTIYFTSLDKIRKENKIKWNDDSLKKAYNEYVKTQIENAKKSTQTNTQNS